MVDDSSKLTVKSDHDKIYHTLWKIIHLMGDTDKSVQCEIFNSITKQLAKLIEDPSALKCTCSLDAIKVWKYCLLLNNLNFFQVKDSHSFWIQFHNEVNFKLNKPYFAEQLPNHSTTSN